MISREAEATVILVGRRKEPLEQVQSELSGGKSHIVVGDVALVDTWKAIADKVKREYGGQIHFLGNNAANPDPGSPWDELKDPQRQIIEYNTINISSVELSYHFLVPLLAKGAASRGKPSIVMNMSSCASVNPRSFCHQLPTYTPAKCAIDAITRCSYGLYKEKNILSYGINPVAYDTPILTIACNNLNLDSPQVLAERYNPFPAMGEPRHVGEIAVTLLLKDCSWLESGCSYNLLPLTPELSSSLDGTAEPQSLLVTTDYAAANIHSDDMLAQLEGWANMVVAFDQKGNKMSAAQLERIRTWLRAKIEALRR